MTDIGVGSYTTQVEKRAWLLSPHGTGPGENPSGTLDVSTLTQATHYPDGYVKSGLVLARNSATGRLEAYKPLGTNGTDTAVGILYGSVTVPDLLNLARDVGVAFVIHGYVNPAKLPIAAGATGGGFLDAAAEVDLKLISFYNADAS